MTPSLLVNITTIFVFVVLLYFVISCIAIAVADYFVYGREGKGGAVLFTFLDGFVFTTMASVVVYSPEGAVAIWVTALLGGAAIALTRALDWAWTLGTVQWRAIKASRAARGSNNHQK